MRKTGCTVHYVNEKLDSGTYNHSKKFFIGNNDNETVLNNKTQKIRVQSFSRGNNKNF